MLIARCIQPTLVKCDSYETLVCNTSNTSNTAINGNDSSYRNPSALGSVATSAITVAVALRYLATAESVSRNARQITPAMQMSTSSANAATVIFIPVEASAPVSLEDA